MNPILESALIYARRGWMVFPLNGKIPFKDTHGFKDSTTEEEQIRSWWVQWPKANVGIATGAGSGIFVVDVDGERGSLSFLDLELAHGKIPETYKVETSRGYHLYFVQPLNEITKSDVGTDKTELGEKIDIRGDGGYVVAPPSIHPDTKKKYNIIDGRLPVNPPHWLLEAVRKEKPERIDNQTHLVSNEIKQGRRDREMVRIAGFFRRSNMTAEEMFPSLLAINNRRCKPPMSEADIQRISKSVSRYPAAKFSETGQLTEEEFIRTKASNVTMRPVDWRWPGYLARGKVIYWAGAPAHGKSTMSFTLAAGFTIGEKFPGDDTGTDYWPESVVILSAEDDKDTTIVPRIKAAGGNLDMITILEPIMQSGKPVSLPAHTLQLSEAIRETEAKLVIIDPLNAFLGADVDSYKNADVRRSMLPIESIARNTGAIMIVIGHLNKTKDASALQRVGGSGAFIEGPRLTFSFGPSQEFEKELVLAPIKVNIAKKTPSLRFTLEDYLIEGVGIVPKVKWGGVSQETADQIVNIPVNGTGHEKTAMSDAKEYLREELREGPKLAKDLQRGISGMFSFETLKRAKEDMGVKSERKNGAWWWHSKDFNWQQYLKFEEEKEL